ncbi:MAG: MFS transporter [Firmicutes bacterium]|nr:MFS transporter [Alicyclobacillaceae bacterium]MCL6496215.1 MFS transporter [Bacillota bacterium]
MRVEGSMSDQAAREGPKTSSGYVATVVIIATLGVLLCAFDSIARNVALPLILQTVHLNIAQGSLVFSGAFVMTFIGDVVMGPLMDRIGRKWTFILGLIAAAVFSGFTAFITAAWQYVVIGILAGLCLAVLQPATILISEEAPAKWRGTLMAISYSGFAAGSIVVSLLASVILPTGNWRVLFYLSFSPLLLVLVAWALLREPPRSAEALRVKRERDRVARGELVRTQFQIDEEKAIRSEWKQIFAPDLRKQTIVTSIVGFLLNFSPGLILVLGVAYITSYDHLPIGVASFALAIEGFAVILGTLAAGAATDRFGPRNVVILWTILGGISVGLMAIPGHEGWVLATMAGYGFFGQGALGSWSRYLADSFPTRARGMGVGFVNGVYFLGGGTLAPALFGAVMNAGHAAAAAWLAGGVSVLGALVLFMGRSIQPRRELEEIAS